MFGQSGSTPSFGADETRNIQEKLWELFCKQAEGFTGGGSSSLRQETAQRLLKSLCFLIGLENDQEPDSQSLRTRLGGYSYDTIFQEGIKTVRDRIRTGEELLSVVTEQSITTPHRAYNKALTELQAFFSRYNYYYFAHEIPCMIYYQPALPVDEKLQGIEYITEYLHRLNTENDFCRRFEPEAISDLLLSHDPNYKDSLINIYETVAGQALALMLLKDDVFSLDIMESHRQKLQDFFDNQEEAETRKQWNSTVQTLCRFLEMEDADAQAYLSHTAEKLFVRFQTAAKTGRLEAVVPSFRHLQDNNSDKTRYIDSPTMENDSLREIIDELSSCQLVSDKIRIMKRNSRSLRDYLEILNIGFWDDESTALFDTLGEEELRLLWRAVRQNKRARPDWESETGWEIKLENYLRGQ